jgi:predicted nucleic acid-binding protein
VRWVVDASVAVKWVIPEVMSDAADRIRGGDDELLAPDLLLIEVANVLWQKTTAKEISAREADTALGLLSESGIDLRPSAPLLPRALELARRLGHPVYDCLYLALAEQARATVVTADQRLLHKTRRLAISIADLRKV